MELDQPTSESHLEQRYEARMPYTVFPLLRAGFALSLEAADATD